VTRLVLAPRAFEDIDRITDLLLENDAEGAPAIGALLRSGIEILIQHPLVGKLIERCFRELVISRGRSGYVALYKYDPVADVVVILAICPQRESESGR
jgi:plasmid stabilization system protein ParE